MMKYRLRTLHASASWPASLTLQSHGDGIVSIRVPEEGGSGGRAVQSGALPHLLKRSLLAAGRIPSTRAVILRVEEGGSLRGGREEYDRFVSSGLFREMASFPLPIIAALSGDALGAGFMIGALCDVMVLSESAGYAFTDPETGLFPGESEARLFRIRFGDAGARDFLYHSARSTGLDLRNKGWTCPIVASSEVDTLAFALAERLRTKSGLSLRTLKRHLDRDLAGLMTQGIADAPEQGAGGKKRTAGTEGKETEQGQAGAMPCEGIRIRCETLSPSVLGIRLCLGDAGAGPEALLAELTGTLARIRDTGSHAAIVLASDYPEFLPDSEHEIAVSTLWAFHQSLLDLDVPVVAAMESAANGPAWLLGQFCEAAVYRDQGNFRTCAWKSPEIRRLAALAVSLRFGRDFAKEILLMAGGFSGLELQERAPATRIASQDQVLAEALRIAERWAEFPPEARTGWRRRSSAYMMEMLDSLPAWPEAEMGPAVPESESKIPAALMPISPVLSVTVSANGIVHVKMEDREAKNMFSEALVKGLAEVFRHIEASPGLKVVILTGYGTYFSSGGTRETLLAIQEGKVRFTDAKVYESGLACKLPVIANMQGHAIGGGWSLGMCADFILFSAESRFICPYMDYGFTPGAGATLVLPGKIGQDLAREALYSGREFSGTELQARSIPFPVAPRAQLDDRAMALAERIAGNSRADLIGYKSMLADRLKTDLEGIYPLELAMHEKTFVGQADTLNRIQDTFAAGQAPLDSVTPAILPVKAGPLVEPAAAPYHGPAGLAEVAEVADSLKTMLAEELHMPPADIEEDRPFIDLGLDSITGVMWMRRINGRFGTSIEATKIYAFPTIAELSGHVRDKAATIDRPQTSVSRSVPAAPLKMNGRRLSLKDVSDVLPKGHRVPGSITASLKRLLAEELHMQADGIDEETPFIDLGLDSITGVTWMRKINREFGTRIEATKVYTHPTLAQLARHVGEESAKAGTGPQGESDPDPAQLQKQAPAAGIALSGLPLDPGQPSPGTLISFRRRAGNKRKAAEKKGFTGPIAVVGMAGQFPMAKNTEAFWENIAQGRDCISEVPSHRWDPELHYSAGKAVPGKSNGKWMGLLERYDCFDPLFFNLSPTEAKSMDPQQRLFLQACWHAIEDAGYAAKSLSGRKCGVFAGCGKGDYQLQSRELQISAHGFTGDETSILAARIAYFLNLRGPCLSIDTACSSSLVALATACDNLVAGHCELALAGGVYVMAGPEMHIKTSQSGMLSQDGRCFTFDRRANGLVPGEAVGVVLLKRLADAEKDNDRILGVIEGWGVNQDGKTNGITAPNAHSQAELQQDVYDRFGIDPASIQLIEAHGTGTRLGDPIEVEGLTASFRKFTREKSYCALGSVKSNIGHCLTAAGISGLIKLILALRHRKLPPTLHFDALNPHIDLDGSPFYVNDTLRDWAAPGRGLRRAAISSFGFSGTNAHMVIAERDRGARETHADAREALPGMRGQGQGAEKLMIPLSARTQEQLQAKAADLLACIENRERPVGFSGLAYTLQVGRDAMDERLGLLADSLPDLAGKLRAFLAGKPDAGSYRGSVKADRENLGILNRDEDAKNTLVEKWLAQAESSKILGLWAKGMDFDWTRLYSGQPPERIGLPGYPFAEERYWIELDPAARSRSIALGKRAAMLHPLVHENISDFASQRYRSTFDGTEFFLADHRIVAEGGAVSKVLPGVAYLEMARAALDSALPGGLAGSPLELRHTAWIKPAIVAAPIRLHIALAPAESAAASEEHIEFEIYGEEEGRRAVHCRGLAVLGQRPEKDTLDLEGLRRRMSRGEAGADAVYRAFDRFGFRYGPAHQSIRSILRGRDQALAEIAIPASIREDRSAFGLHPSLMDGALQASIGLLEDLEGGAGSPALPFALESLRILSPCAERMFAWIRPAAGGRPQLPVIRLDIDLCDTAGRVAVRMRGFTSRVLENGTGKAPSGFDSVFYQELIERILSKRTSVENALEIG